MNLSEVQIDAAAVLHNLEALKDLVPKGMQVAAVVKGNAYGHGLEQVVRILEGRVDAFQVDDLEELRALRSLTSARAIVLGCVPNEGLAEALSLDGELALYDRAQVPAFAKAADEAGRPAKVHLEIDALLGRLGFLPDAMDEAIEELKGCAAIQPVAAYGHFANIEDTTDQTHAYAQIESFETAFGAWRAAFPNLGRHMSATSGLMTIEPIRRGYDLVRLGIGLYGMYPSGPLERTHAYLGLRPAMRWVSHLAQVKTLPPKHPIGYGLTYFTGRETRVGIVPQGYSDGYDRGLSNTGEVLVRGRRCPVLGRVAMNMFTIDLSEVDAEAGDEVVLFGRQGDERVTAEDMAARLGTINYEVATRVSSLLPRAVVTEALGGG